MLNYKPPEISALDAARIRNSQQSWWQVRYESGKVVSEWDTLIDLESSFLSRLKKMVQSPLGPGASSRWEEIPKIGIRGLYLLCPNGKAAALEGDGTHTFFQLKVGFKDLSFGLNGDPQAFPRRRCRAHLIGKVDREDGHCICYAWEYEETMYSIFECKVCNGFGSKKLKCPGCGNPNLVRVPLISFEDNVTNLAYENIGALSLGHHTGVI